MSSVSVSTTAKSPVALSGVTHRYPATTTITLNNVSLSIAPGELVALYGPVGCGKSTLMRVIHGMERPVYGHIYINGLDVTNRSPNERGAVMAFESYALYPHMTVRENLGFALQIAGVDDEEITRRVLTAAEHLGFADHLDSTPNQITGPMRQAVALGRAMVRIPQVLLVDDPLAKTNDHDRTFSRAKFADLQRVFGMTTLVVARTEPDVMEINARTVTMDRGNITGSIEPDELTGAALQLANTVTL